jgi:hypothetical protein
VLRSTTRSHDTRPQPSGAARAPDPSLFPGLARAIRGLVNVAKPEVDAELAKEEAGKAAKGKGRNK